MATIANCVIDNRDTFWTRLRAAWRVFRGKPTSYRMPVVRLRGNEVMMGCVIYGCEGQTAVDVEP